MENDGKETLMDAEKNKSELSLEIEKFVKAGFHTHFGLLGEVFRSDPAWQKMHALGTELWLDTGSAEVAEKMWTHQFSALTTNNTLLNKEVQKGTYDSLMHEVEKLLAEHPGLSDKKRMLEIAFILNARHALWLVEKFDAHVSVEEHTDLANDVELAVDYARRYHAVCPERFIIKIPFTPAGLLATRRLATEAVPVNHTLGFSARQNYVIARIAQPAYVNVFLGRLNSFVAKNKLGDGSCVGEKATLASQAAVKKLRNEELSPSRLIGASFREGAQVRDLAGIDVMTMPPKVAAEFMALQLEPGQIDDKTGQDYTIGVNPDVDQERIRLDTLWDVDDKVVACVDALENENIESFTPDDLLAFFKEHRCGDVLVKWTDSQIQTSAAEGKIPNLDNWRDALADKSVGLDALMNLAGLNSFKADQKAMDDRVRNVLAKTPAR